MRRSVDGKRRAAGGRIVSGLALAGAGVLGVVAVIDATRDEPSAIRSQPTTSIATIRGPDVPAPGSLEGQLVFADASTCRVAALDLKTLSLAEDERSSCRLWPSGTSDAAVLVADANQNDAGLYGIELGDVPGGREEASDAVLGTAVGEVSWSQDGRWLAWCEPSGTASVISLTSGASRTVEGCAPVVADGGSVLTKVARVPADRLLRDGRVVLDREAMLGELGDSRLTQIDVLGFDVRADGLIAVAVEGRGPDTGPTKTVQLWLDGRLIGSLELDVQDSVPGMYGHGRFGGLVRFSPDGRELAVSSSHLAGNAGDYPLVLIDIRSRRVVAKLRQHGFAWSPDGGWLAYAEGDRITVAASVRTEATYVIPIAVTDLAWRRTT